MKFSHSLMLAGVLALGCGLTAQADTMEPGVHPDREVREGCSSALTQWDVEQLRELEATGIYDNEDPSREVGTYLVYLAFHIVRTSSGTGGIAQSQLDQALIDLADAFVGTGICFTVAYTDYIDNTTYYNIDNDAERAVLKGINNQANMLDCYFVNYDGGYCGVSSFTWSTEQGITFDNGCVGVASNPSTFPHEVGHYFNLLHTHEPAYGNECPTGSNCSTAGDLVCDTPADPELGTGNVNTSCNYTGSEVIFCDFAVRSYNPDPTNLMSYSRKTCRTNFTPGQRSRMLATLTSAPRWGEVGFYSPDFDFSTPTGWSNAVVPRNTTGGSSASCLVTSTLPGNSNTTYYNQAMRQANSSSHNPGVYGRAFLDNVYTIWYSYGGGTWSGTQYWNNVGPITVRGGRHALHSTVDYFDEVCESNESDNTRNTQWVWSPYVLGDDQSLQRSTPPEKMTTTWTYPNCDGFQLTGNSWWSAVAIQPLTTTADFDVYLHNDYTGSTAGFATTLATSTYGSGQNDWVIVNHNQAGYGGTYQAGIINYDGETADVRTNRINSRTLSKTDGTRICGTLPSNRIMDIFEVYFSTDDIADTWTVTLSSDDAADLDLYIYDAAGSFYGRNQYLENSQTNGTSDEVLTLTANTDLAASGWYSFVIAKDELADLTLQSTYEVKFTNNSNKLTINPTSTVQVAVIQDANPYGSAEWLTQLTAFGYPHTVIPTADIASTNLDAYGVVIIPTPVTIAAHDNIQANLALLDAYNDRGGVLIQGTATSINTDGFYTAGGVLANWETCAVAHPSSHILVTGVGADAPGSSAVHHVLTAPGAGWTNLAWTDCGTNQSCMLLNDADGLLIYGAPMEHSVANYDCTLGESIENIVQWAYKRAKQTIRVTRTPIQGSAAVVLNYNKSILTSVTYTNTESLSWLTVNPLSGTIPVLDGGDPITFTMIPGGNAAGIYRGAVTVGNTLYNSTELVYAYMNLVTRKPAVPINLTMVPLDFSPGHATVNASWTPVTQDINGQAITVEAYRLYYDDDFLFGSSNYIDVATTNINLFYANVGMLDMGFLRVAAIDLDGLVVGDSQPDAPLPLNAVPGNPLLLGVPQASTSK